MYANDNVDLPTLNPWVNTTPSPAQRFVFVRNPYYHRIDATGRQLPYIDRVIFTAAETCRCRKRHPRWISRPDGLGWDAMLDFLRLFVHVLAMPFRTQARLEAEITMLRHQLNVLRRQAPSRPRLTPADRLLFVWLCRLFPSLKSAIAVDPQPKAAA
jgi:hypothetical protein